MCLDDVKVQLEQQGISIPVELQCDAMPADVSFQDEPTEEEPRGSFGERVRKNIQDPGQTGPLLLAGLVGAIILALSERG